MTLQEDMESKRAGEWTQDDINALKSKYRRTHFDHFRGSPIKLKRAPRKRIRGVEYMKVFGQWVKVK